MMMTTTRSALIAALLLWTPLAPAQDALTAPAEVQRAAERFLQQRVAGLAEGVRVHVAAASLDPRLRLPRCGEPLQAFLPTGARPAARTTVGVRCTAPSWTVHVPVGAETEMKVLVARRALPRLARVETQDVELQVRRVPGFPATYLTGLEALAGHHLRASVAPGTALSVDQLARDVLVRRGQRVTLLSRAGGIEVAAAGEALGDASPEGRVRVQNLASRRVVEGVAETADRVRVGP